MSRSGPRAAARAYDAAGGPPLIGIVRILYNEVRTALLVLTLVPGGAAPAAAQEDEAGPGELVTVDLAYVGDQECATADPDPAKIHVGQGVEWVIADGGQVSRYAFRVVGKEGPALGLGPSFPIPCGRDSVKSGISNKPGTWTYDVQVLRCPETGQVKPGTEPLCVLDPSVIVSEPPGGERGR